MLKTYKSPLKNVSSDMLLGLLAAFAAMALFCIALMIMPIIKDTGLETLENIISLPEYDVRTLQHIRSTSLSTDITVIPMLRNILTENADPLFLFALALPESILMTYFLVVSVLKIGGAAFCMHLMLGRSMGNTGNGSVLLSLLYALSSPVLSDLQNRSLLDLAVILPLILFFALDAVRYNDFRHLLRFSAVLAASIIVCGVFCASAVVLFSLAVSLLLSSCEDNTVTGAGKLLHMMCATIAGVIFSGISSVPMTALIPKEAGLLQLFKDSDVRFKLFDWLLYSIDGRSPDTAVVIDPFSISVLVILLVMLFFVHPLINFGRKLAFGSVMVFIYITVVYEPFDRIFSVWGQGGDYAAARILCMAVLCFYAAGMTLKMIDGISRTAFWGAAVIVTGFLLISNTGLNDVKGPVFPLYLTAAVLLFWGICFSRSVTGRKEMISAAVLTVAVAGILFNLIWVLPGSHIKRITPDTLSGPAALERDEEFDLFSSDGEYSYIVLSSDATDAFDTLSFPEGINALSRAALLDDIFTRAYTEEMYSSGFERIDEGLYRTEDNDRQCELILKAYYADTTGQTYYIGSDFSGVQYLTVMYSGGDEVFHFDDSFFMGFEPSESDFPFRIAIPDPSAETCTVGLWQLDRPRYEALKTKFRPLGQDLTVTPGDDPMWRLTGPLTVVTSIPYDPLYTAKRGNDRASVVNCMGHLGVLLNNDEEVRNEPVIINVYKEDIRNGIITTLAAIASAAAGEAYRKKAATIPQSGAEGA